jgi:2-phosphoglycerate kinase
MEGVHIHPALIEKVSGDLDAHVIPIMLGVINKKSLRNRIKGRGKNVPHRRAERYLDHFDSIWQLQSFLLSEADQADVPIIISEDRDDVFREIMQITINRLSRDFDKTPEQVF